MYKRDRTKHNEYNRKYRILHREEIYLKHKEYREKNRKIIRIKSRLYEKTKRNFTKRRLASALRHRLREALKDNFRKGSAIRDLGCSIEHLKKHLESKFQVGMTWKNWGHFGWHIDHIVPLSKFDLTNRKEILIACNWKNLRPMWWIENLKKGIKTDESALSSIVTCSDGVGIRTE